MYVQRFDKNPIVKPQKIYSWQAEATFNGCPIRKDNKIYLLYRALSLPHFHTISQQRLRVSDIGIAESFDGTDFYNHKRLVIPEYVWERFGCEDPRVTQWGNDYYIFYTALSEYPPRAEGIKVGLAITSDLVTIKEKHLITPFNAKAMALFPERINGKLWTILTAHTDYPPAKICLASFEKESDLWSQTYWEAWYKNVESYALPIQRLPEDHIEVGAPPLKTKDGWLVIYSYIRNYFSPDRLFGIEAVLLDLKDPSNMIGRTDAPFLTPEEYYERIGIVPNVIFPSGAFLEENTIHLYYGASDTTCCLAYIKLDCLLEKMKKKSTKRTMFHRAKENPIVSPIPSHPWESKATLNPAAVILGDEIHLLYRAMSQDNTSVFGYAATKDGIHIDYRSPDPAYIPREPFEQKMIPGGNSGCEDPRLTRIGDKLYMLYTAFNGKDFPRVALSWISVDDFLKKQWNWSKPVPISAPCVDDKDACVFPEKVAGKYLLIHRCGDDIDFAYAPTMDFDGKTWLEEYRWIGPRKGMWDDKRVGIAGPPFKTDKGWILLYHGISSQDGGYRVGACLLSLDDPTNVLARLDEPVFEPEMRYEKTGLVANVVFPCGTVILHDTVFMYYGGGDTVVGVATIPLTELLHDLAQCTF